MYLQNEFEMNKLHNCEYSFLIKCQICVAYVYHLTYCVLRLLCDIQFQCLDRRILTFRLYTMKTKDETEKENG